ncbi:MAG TPA: S53 family peptidase [Gaiellaceae bacterium]|nr:S53 family peptidase [Gaiellaceae bacterium]
MTDRPQIAIPLYPEVTALDAARRPQAFAFAAIVVLAAASVTGCGAYGPAPPKGAGPRDARTSDCRSLTTCYTPRQLDVAYGVQPLLRRGFDGRGETVVLPELAKGFFPSSDYSDLRQDVARFDRLFGLPATTLRVVNRLARSGSPWEADQEEVLDTEMVHAIAPGAAITILLVKPSSLTNASRAVAASVAALRLGAHEGAVISISAAGQTGGEHCDTPEEVNRLNAALRNAERDRVTVVAASGDIGAVGEPCDLSKGLLGGAFPPVKEVNLPASDPLVLAVGGTTLSASHTTGRYGSEAAWGLPFGDPGTQFQASGGGFSRLFPRPNYQRRMPEIGSARGVPDVASDAAPHTGMALITSAGGGRYTIRNSGGTSAAAPLWAALIALADQYAHRHLGFINPTLYRIARSSDYQRAFHQITGGTNSVSFPSGTVAGYQAGPGWNPVTGWGSPDAGLLIPLLAHRA